MLSRYSQLKCFDCISIKSSQLVSQITSQVAKIPETVSYLSITHAVQLRLNLEQPNIKHFVTCTSVHVMMFNQLNIVSVNYTQANNATSQEKETESITWICNCKNKACAIIRITHVQQRVQQSATRYQENKLATHPNVPFPDDPFIHV